METTKGEYTVEENNLIIRMRNTMKPKDIALALGRTESAIKKQLSKLKQERNLQYPRLEHGLTKYSQNYLQTMRRLNKVCTYKMLGEQYNINPDYLAKRLAAF